MTIRRADTESIAGFTLIEIIVTIVVGAILAAVMVQFMSTAMTHSGDPAAAVRTEADTNTVMVLGRETTVETEADGLSLALTPDATG